MFFLHFVQPGGTLATIFVQFVKPGAQRHNFVGFGYNFCAIDEARGNERTFFLCILSAFWLVVRGGRRSVEEVLFFPLGKTNGVGKGNRDLVRAKQC